MDSPTGIIPEEYMFREMRRAVRAWLIAQPYPAEVKRDLLFAWARTVGVKISEKEVIAVQQSGHTGGTEV